MADDALRITPANDVPGLVIALLLRAVVAPLLLVATTALSFGASFGLTRMAAARLARARGSYFALARKET